jgi:hypothetical protein
VASNLLPNLLTAALIAAGQKITSIAPNVKVKFKAAWVLLPAPIAA